MPFKEIAESTYDWESWISPEGHALWVNAAVSRITGYSVEECLAHPEYPLFLVHPEDRSLLETVLVDARQGGSGNHYEFRILRKDGSVRWGAISWQPLTQDNGETRGYRSSVRDIDDRKKMEVALRRSIEKAEAANNAKTIFLASVSHELRTPLQSILGYGELIAKGSGEDTPRYAERIVSQAKWLAQMVGDLLDFSSMQAGGLPLQLETCVASEIVNQAVDDLIPMFKTKGVKLTCSAGANESVRCDGKRVTQILNNLVGNALKFTEKGSVEVESSVSDEANWTISVSDTGPGVPPSKRQTIFDPFHQEDSMPAGVGLGLAISRHLAEAMGGGIICEENPAGGARFVVTLKTDTSHAGRTQPASPKTPQATHRKLLPENSLLSSTVPLKVLIVDDVEPAREFLHEAMSSVGCECQSAGSALDGYRILDDFAPQLVLLDIQMPSINGWTAAREIRKRLGSEAYLVAMSASGLAHDPDRLKSSGFDSFCLKPVGITELRQLATQARTRHALPSGSTFDPVRWEELSGVTTSHGDNLLTRMLSRVSQTLPEALEELRLLRASEDVTALATALHKVSGLLALVGARQAHTVVTAAEDAATKPDGTGLDRLVDRAIETTEQVILELRSNHSLHLSSNADEV